MTEISIKYHGLLQQHIAKYSDDETVRQLSERLAVSRVVEDQLREKLSS